MTTNFITLHDDNGKKIMINAERIVGYSADPSTEVGSVLYCDVIGNIRVIEPPEYLALFLPSDPATTPKRILEAIKEEKLRRSKE